MAEPFLAEIRIMSFNFPPKGWAFCDGQLLPINQNQALFSLLGTTYGGDGQRTFGLPNLQGRVPMHMGNGHVLGESAGTESHTVNIAELPSHIHTANGVNANATLADPTGHTLAAANTLYHPSPGNTQLAPTTITSVGGSQPHENRQPYLTLNFSIALQGIFPSQT
jgi:microcystin-dependent protein